MGISSNVRTAACEHVSYAVASFSSRKCGLSLKMSKEKPRLHLWMKSNANETIFLKIKNKQDKKNLNMMAAWAHAYCPD